MPAYVVANLPVGKGEKLKSIFAACLTVIALAVVSLLRFQRGIPVRRRQFAIQRFPIPAHVPGSFTYPRSMAAQSHSLQATRSANSGRGFSLVPIVIERQVPAAVVNLKLEARTAYGAPIQELAMAARMYSVEEVVEAELRPGTRYVVRGQLRRGQDCGVARGTRVGAAGRPDG